jgi:thioredoxin 2
MQSIIVKCAACEAKNRISAAQQHLHPRCGKCKKSLDIQSHVVPVDLGDSSMDEFLQAANLPVLVDFFSPTCGPCASLAPLLDGLTRQFFGRIIVAKVDTGKNPGCSAHYQVRGVPTLIFFKKGRVVEQMVGLPDANHLKAKMEYFAK